MTPPALRKALVPLLSCAMAVAACTEVNEFVSEAPPSSGGAFTPAGGGPPGGYGYGAAYGTGGGDVEPPGPPQCAEPLRLCDHTFTLPYGGESSVELRGGFAPGAWEAGVPMVLTGETWSATVKVPWDAAVAYKFFADGAWVIDPNNPETVDDGFGGLNSLLTGVTCEEWTCQSPTLGDFDWRDAVLYFVFVDRFRDGKPGNNGAPTGAPSASDYQGGDWAGLLSVIEDGYFEELGVNALWLSVPMQNTDSTGLGDDGRLYSAYHGYWPTDLDSTEPRYGSLDELVAVVDAAHEHGLKVIVDYAMNHVHAEAPVYADHPDWFWPLNNNGAHCVCGDGCNWDGADGRRCWFRDYLPDFNFNVAAARDFSVGNAISWITKTGIDGYRLDAVKHIEDSWLLDLRARVQTEIEAVTQQHFYMVGETFTGDRDTIKYYVDPFSMLDGQFDFPLRAAMVGAFLTRTASMQDLNGFLASNDGFYGAGVMSTFIGNHDVPRSIHFAQDSPLWSDVWASGKDRAWTNLPNLPGGASAFERMATAFTMLYALPGVPLIYYGDEIGLPGAGDPDNRRFMQWSGYSAAQLMLKERVAKLGAIRAAHPALRRGSRTTLSVTNDTLAFRMTEGADVVIVVLNRGDSPQTVGSLPGEAFVDALTDQPVSGPSVSMPARSAKVLVAP